MRHIVERAIAHATLRLPRAVLLGLIGQDPRVVDGQTLDYQIQFGLALEARRNRAPLYQMSPQEARAAAVSVFEVLDVGRREVASARDWMAHDDDREPVPVRVYAPRAHRGGMLVFFHGGGGVIGSVESYDNTCRYLATVAEVVVVSVDYRLAPEHPYPVGIDDALTAYRWARSHAARFGANPERVAVGGDSMGANFAAEVCLRCRAGAGPMPAYQWLIYPGTDLDRSSASHRTFGAGYGLDAPMMSWFMDLYLAGHDPRDPLASPLYADDLAGVPPALVVTAGFDPLRDEGSQYANHLRAAGVEVAHTCHAGLVHGFIQMGGAIASARAAIDAAARQLHEALA